jgi:hypothetical protein
LPTYEQTSDVDPITGEPDPPRPHGVGGSRKGRPNKITKLVREAIVEAAALVGEDGDGRGGLVGYLKLLAVTEPRAMAALLGRILPLQVNADVEVRETRTIEEVAAELERRGVPVGSLYGRAEV